MRSCFAIGAALISLLIAGLLGYGVHLSRRGEHRMAERITEASVEKNSHLAARPAHRHREPGQAVRDQNCHRSQAVNLQENVIEYW